MPQTKVDQEDEAPIKNPNRIRDIIYTSLAITEYTKVPILFLGNPGIAKTSGVRKWCENNGYRVTTLIGTQRVAEEILGYMVNDVGERKLITYTPDWFDEIMENKEAGFRTLLFIDELSQAPDNVQGAMLQLIFDRKVGGRNNYLPEDCLVVSAANYKGNIPPQCGIQAPTLNRFCLINVQYEDGPSLVSEFLQPMDAREEQLPSFLSVPITPKIEQSIRGVMTEMFELIFGTYSQKNNDGAVLDVNNTEYQDMFDKPGPIYNFISGRTVHYLFKTACGLFHLGILRKRNKEVIDLFAKGLVGLGTNSFKSQKEQDDYELSLMTGFMKVLTRTLRDNKEGVISLELNFKGKSIDSAISEWLGYKDSHNKINDVNLQRLMEMIRSEYGTSADAMAAKLNSGMQLHQMLGDIQKLNTLLGDLKTCGLREVANYVKELELVCASWESYKTAIIASI